VPAEGARRPGGTRLADAARVREEGRALLYLLAREDNFRFPDAQARGPRHGIRGRQRNNLGAGQSSAARYPGNAAGPVLQHRPSGTPPKLWTEPKGLAM
jgi:hypothetical protein